MNRRLFVVAVLLGVVLPVAALLLAAAGPEPVPAEHVSSDLAWYFVPTFAVLRRALQEGFFPLWNPWQLAGWPFLGAFQTQALYAPAWAVAGLPPHLAVTAYAVLHWAFAFVGMTLLATTLGMRWGGALASAAVYALSGVVVDGFFLHSAALALCAWLPWDAAAAVVLVRSGPVTRPLVAFAFCIAMTIVAGGPEHLAYAVPTVFVFGVWQSMQRDARGTIHGTGLLLAGFALALLFAAAQILPTAELRAYALRSAASSYSLEYVTRFQLDAGRLLHNIVHGGAGIGRLSALLLPLVLAGLWARRTRRPVAVLVALALFTLDFLRGTNGWIFPIYYEWIPLARSFRTNIRVEFIWAFLASLAAGFGVDAFQHAFEGKGGKAGTAAVAVLLVALFGELLGHSFAGRIFLPLRAPQLLYGSEDLARAVEDLPGPDRVFVDYGAPSGGLQHKFGQMQGVRNVAEYDALLPAKYSRLFDVPPSMPWMGRLQFADRSKQVGTESVKVPGVSLAALDVLSTRYYLTRTSAQSEMLQWNLKGSLRHQGLFTVIERPLARPRAYVVHKAIAVADDDAALAALKSPGFAASGAAVILGDPPLLEDKLPEAAEGVRWIRDDPNEVAVNATCGSRCLLVLTDLDFPGWSARVDGIDSPILHANYLVRAIALEKGSHEVSFLYRPWSWTIGLSISVVSLLLAFAAVVRTRLRETADAEEAVVLGEEDPLPVQP